MKISELYYKFNGEALVAGPFALPELHWLAPGKAIKLSAENASTFGYESVLQFDQFAELLIQAQIDCVNAEFTQAAASLVSDTPQAEREGWNIQREEALAWNANNAAATPYVDAIAASREITREVLLAKIIANVQMYQAAHAELTGKRQRLVKALEDLRGANPTVSDVLALSWS